MSRRIAKLLRFLLLGVTGAVILTPIWRAQGSRATSTLQIPKTWDEEALATLEVPLANAGASPVHIGSEYYYRMPVRPIYRSYPVYAPGREPAGYLRGLELREPEIVFNPAQLETEADWIRAGELVFDAPITYDADRLFVVRASFVRDPTWYERTRVPVTRDGVMPFARYVIRKRGEVEVGSLSCAMCHTRVMSDGKVIKGAQGNFPFHRALAYLAQVIRPEEERIIRRALYSSPWLQPDPQARTDRMSRAELTALDAAIPPGVMARHGTSYFSPVQVPDLIGIRDRRYLDRTGLVRHGAIGDLMRYAALNQDADLLSLYESFRPIEVLFGRLPDPVTLSRYSDEQLYALALYLYSLDPPHNPNRRSALAARGEGVFQNQGCAVCHTPPLYTNNKLTPAPGFKIPDDHLNKYDILPLSVGTDPTLAVTTRRGTGYYKVPSLKGVWYRGPFEHNGSVASLEDWFDPRRLREDYVPTGYKGYGVRKRAVRGHEFGLKLSREDKAALIAFLKTL